MRCSKLSFILEKGAFSIRNPSGIARIDCVTLGEAFERVSIGGGLSIRLLHSA